ncbi:hypothetical protein DB35_15865 [Streptomyces abyssalis]|uniref:Uncharacterized protein n=1 Tax=Streptomyces abyssalis TaxID=933944 RepID=A0A1E7JFS2_9ACTN|nr:hypothetical protein [Streptomyces abyssalis]OEU85302.1 hypothetical protein AN215_22155 [Streptomyces abyssalis]OEU91530.1 hypothetical protein DB35_15865 [Streptomyces abyssalis]
MPAPPWKPLTRDIALVVAAPLVLAGFGLSHPGGLRPHNAQHWAELHIWLLPVWPLLALGVIVPLWGRPRRDAEGAATVVAWAGAFGYAVYYTGLDAVAGIAAGIAEEHGGERRREVVRPLFHTGDALGQAGVWCLGAAAVAASVALCLRYGARVLPGTAVLLVCCWSFLDSHIFHPRGVVTMLGFALGFALFVVAAARPPKAAGPEREA